MGKMLRIGWRVSTQLLVEALDLLAMQPGVEFHAAALREPLFPLLDHDLAKIV